MKLTFISDTHTAEVPLGSGDILFHSGDLTYHGRTKETKRQLDWISKADYTHKIITPGNHEVEWEAGHVPFERYCEERGIVCLINEAIEVEGIKIYGSPVTPEFCGWAYMHEIDKIGMYWEKIPDDTDVLLTHGPPRGILDLSLGGTSCGCPILRQEVLNRIKPKIHAFGHIHEGHGQTKINDTTFINAAIMNRSYYPTNKPTIINWSEL